MASKRQEAGNKGPSRWVRGGALLRGLGKWCIHLLWYRKLEDDPVRQITEATNGQANEYAERYRERFMSLGGESLKTMYGFMKGIALTTATLVILQVTLKIWPDIDTSKPLDPYIILCYVAWFISFLVLLITYEAPLSGALLIFELPPFWVTLLPALFIIFEFLAFAILAPEVFVSGDLANVAKWGFKERLGRWCLINGVYHIAISLFCWLAERYYRGVRINMPATRIGRAWKAYRDAVEEQRIGSRWVGVFSLALGLIYWKTQLDEDSSLFLKWSLALIPLMFIGVAISLRRQYIHRDTVHTFMTERL